MAIQLIQFVSKFPSVFSRAKSCTKLSEYYVIHINTLISYFRIGDAKLRMNAVHFLTFLLAENSRLVVESDLVNPERICSEFSKLLANDPSDEVINNNMRHKGPRNPL